MFTDAVSAVPLSSCSAKRLRRAILLPECTTFDVVLRKWTGHWWSIRRKLPVEAHKEQIVKQIVKWLTKQMQIVLLFSGEFNLN